MIREIWSRTNSGNSPMEQWQGKIRRLKQHLRGWAKNISEQYKKEKKIFYTHYMCRMKKQKVCRYNRLS
jgi:hypothetical protein